MVCGWMKQGQYYIFTINFFMSKFTVKQSKNRSNKTKQKKILKTERETMVELSMIRPFYLKYIYHVNKTR